MTALLLAVALVGQTPYMPPPTDPGVVPRNCVFIERVEQYPGGPNRLEMYHDRQTIRMYIAEVLPSGHYGRVVYWPPFLDSASQPGYPFMRADYWAAKGYASGWIGVHGGL